MRVCFAREQGMLINLSDVLNTSAKEKRFEISPELKSFDGSFGEIEILSSDTFVIDVKNVEKGKAKISGSVNMKFLTQCDRCLKDTEVDLNITFERECAGPEYEVAEDDDLHEFMEGYQLDVDALLYNEITVNWPVKILCRDDCKGLCLVCGHDLNVGDCGCDTFVPDPRMAALKDIFETTKEV